MQFPDGTIRKKLIRWESGPPIRYLTFSCYHRLPLLAQPGAPDMFVENLARARDRFGFSLIAGVVMPEHVHLILRPHPSGSGIPSIIRGIKQPVAQRVLRRLRADSSPILTRLKTAGGETRFWQEGGGFDRNVRDAMELARDVDYIHLNPVKRGLVSRPEDWAWSSYLEPQASLPAADHVRSTALSRTRSTRV